MKNEFNLLEFYEQIYSKGEKKHFTPFLKSTKTIEIKEILKLTNWKNKSVLDVGCGTGELAYQISKKGSNVLGIDFSTEAIKIANSNFSQKNLKFKNMNVKEIKDKFDIIISTGTFEHMKDPLSILKLFKRHLNKNGQIIILCPNWTNPRGYILMTLFYLFNSPITLADLHYFSPKDFENFSKIINMKLKWKTFDRSWAHGDDLIFDLKKRLPNVLRDSSLPKSKKNIDHFLNWINLNIVSMNNDLPHSGAIAIYLFT